VARGELWRLVDAEVGAVFAGLDAARRVLEAAQVAVLAEAASRGLPDQVGCSTPGKWARAMVEGHCDNADLLARRAQALYAGPVAGALEPTREAMLAGGASGRQVDVVVQAVTKLSPPACPVGTVHPDEVADLQTILLDQARTEPDLAKLKKSATRAQGYLDPDADERLRKDEAARDLARGLTMSRSPFSGMVHVDGTLTPECGAALEAAIDAFSAPRPSADGTPDLRSAAQRRHDGLRLLCQKAVGTDGFLASTHGSPYRITVTVPHETFAAALAGTPFTKSAEPADASEGECDGRYRPMAGLAPALLEPDGTPLSSLTLQTLACSAEVLAVLVDEVGNPLDVADTHRLHTPRQRAAVVARDGCCTWPGCQAPPAWSDVHHVVWHSRGGPTTVVNGALLCGYHHRYVHRTDQTAVLIEGRVVWQTDTPPRQRRAQKRHPGGEGQLTLDGSDIPVRPTTRADRAVEALARRWRARRT
jgi:hypothetical protein